MKLTKITVIIAILLLAMTAASSADIITFRQGIDGYTGAQDATLHSGEPDTLYGADQEVEVDSDTLRHGIVRYEDIFDSIPADSMISSAILYIDIDNTGDDILLYRLAGGIAWDESLVTWNNFGGTLNDGVVIGTDTEGTPTLVPGDGSPGLTDGDTFIDVTLDVAAWYGGAENNGWAFLPTGSDGVDFDSSNHVTVKAPEPKA